MSVQLDRELAEKGTKFRIFPQSRVLNFPPETIVVSIPPDQMRPGPADDRMFVVDAINKQPYDFPFGPPYTGAQNPPVQPGPDGHFDHLDVDSREFKCATMYAQSGARSISGKAISAERSLGTSRPALHGWS